MARPVLPHVGRHPERPPPAGPAHQNPSPEDPLESSAATAESTETTAAGAQKPRHRTGDWFCSSVFLEGAGIDSSNPLNSVIRGGLQRPQKQREAPLLTGHLSPPAAAGPGLPCDRMTLTVPSGHPPVRPQLSVPQQTEKQDRLPGTPRGKGSQGTTPSERPWVAPHLTAFEGDLGGVIRHLQFLQSSETYSKNQVSKSCIPNVT